MVVTLTSTGADLIDGHPDLVRGTDPAWVVMSTVLALEKCLADVDLYRDVGARLTYEARREHLEGARPSPDEWFEYCFGRPSMPGEEGELLEQTRSLEVGRVSGPMLFEVLGVGMLARDEDNMLTFQAFANASYRLVNLLPL